jgi:hypothetical protein
MTPTTNNDQGGGQVEPAVRQAAYDHLAKLYRDLESENRALREALGRVTEELAELIKDEVDDPSVGIRGWTSLHESVASARALLTPPQH